MGELEDKEFELLLAEKRHKEIIDIMNKMFIKLSEGLSTPDVSVDTSGMEKVLKSLKSKPESSALPNSIKKMTDVLIKKLDSLKQEEQPKEWIFTIERSNNGLIKTVKAKSN